MTSTYYHSPELPWSPSLSEERRFRVIATAMLVLYLMLAALVLITKVPPVNRYEEEIIPPRLAKLVIQEKPKPPPPPPPKVEEKKPEPKPKPKPEKKPEKPKPPKPQPEVKKAPPKPDVQAARKKAEHSGLLALSSELADLRQNDLGNLMQNKPLAKVDKKTNSVTHRSIIAAEGTKGSGGISASDLSHDVEQTKLAGRKTTTVENQTLEVEKQAAAQSGGARGRSIEQIQLTLDRSKGALYTLYHRALRSNPALQGKVVLEITIAPSGEVTQCKVISAELDDPKLVSKLSARIRLLNFGAKDVATTVFTWPIDFLPSS